MPGGRTGTLRDALQVLKEYRNSRAPQKGFFSTLDQAIQDAPFENAPLEQWRGYLKPGRMVRRGDMQFPLKQEELDYTLKKFFDFSDVYENPSIAASRDATSLNKHALLKYLREHRPSFALTVGDDTLQGAYADSMAARGRIDEIEERLAQLHDPNAPRGMRRFRTAAPQYGPRTILDEDFEDRLSHQSPGSAYQESVTRLQGLDYGRQHFEPETISHSRTSSHQAPAGRVRLVEEIQSDLHQDATDRLRDYDWLRLLTPEEEARRAELEHLIAEGDGPYRRTNSPERVAAETEFEQIRDAARKRIPRRGYRTPEESMELARIANEMSASRSIISPEYAARQSQLASAVPDAPFKTPAEYGRLELRKQLLNAVNDGEDFLAITPGQTQIERYSLEGKKAENMARIYDEVYRGELEKLARQYGTEVVDVEVPLSTKTDARPRIMREYNIEDADELEEFMNGGMLQGGMDELFSDTSYVDSVFHQIADLAEETEIPKAEYARIKANLREVLDRVGVKFDDTGHAQGAEVTGGRGPGSVRMTAATGARTADPVAQDKWIATMNWVANHVRGWMNGPGRARVAQAVKTFPAMRITDEVRRRVQQAGVPLWSLGAGAVGLESLRQDAEELGAEPSTDRIGFAKGGSVKRVLRDLFDAKEGAGAVPNNQDVDYRGFATEMPIWKFLHLAKHLRDEDVRRGSMAFLKEHVRDGGTLGQPFLNVRWMPEEERWQVMGHDGRHRAKFLAETYGEDALIPVHIIPEGEMRARHIAPYMRKAPFLGEAWKDTALNGDPMNIRPGLKGVEGYAAGGYASAKQARLMRAVAHGWKPSRIRGPSRAVANEFVDKKDRGLQEGGLAAALAASRAEAATHHAPPERQPPRDHRLLDRLRAAYETQLSGFDDEGNLRPMAYTDWDAPKEEWVLNGEAQMLLPPTKYVRPGMVDDILSLPVLVDDIGDATQALDLPFQYDTNLRDFDLVGGAEQRMAELSQAVQDKYQLDEPQGLLEHGADAAGMMLSQLTVPVPSGAAVKPLSRGRKFLKTAAGAPLEFFSPTVVPKLENYAAGTAFGAAMGEYGDDVVGGVVGMFQDDPEAAMAAADELPPDLKVAILEYLLAQKSAANRGQ